MRFLYSAVIRSIIFPYRHEIDLTSRIVNSPYTTASLAIRDAFTYSELDQPPQRPIYYDEVGSNLSLTYRDE